MIKYLGSKRRLVPVLEQLAVASGAERALDLFTGTTRVAQAFKRQGMEVTAVDSARYSEVFARCYIETDARTVDHRALGDALAYLGSLPGRPGYFTETFCVRSRFFQPFNGARIDAIRQAIADEFAGSPLEPLLLTSLHRGGRPGRLHHRPADGLRQAVGRPLVQAPGAADAGPAGRWRTGRAGRRRVAGRPAGPGRPGLPRPPVQPAPVLHQLPRVGDPGRLGRPGALRRGLQAPRRPRPVDQERLQLAPDHAGRPAPAGGRRRLRAPAAVLQRRVVDRGRRAGGHVPAAPPEVAVLRFASARYVGARIGIHNPRGERWGGSRTW